MLWIVPSVVNVGAATESEAPFDARSVPLLAKVAPALTFRLENCPAAAIKLLLTT